MFQLINTYKNQQGLHITPIKFNDDLIFLAIEIADQLGYGTLSDNILRSPIMREGLDYIKLTGSNLKELKKICNNTGLPRIAMTVPSLLVLRESGLYKLLLRSDKAVCQEFANWVVDEVLPQIRKTGSYSLATHIDCEAESLRILEIRIKKAKLLNVPEHLGMIEAVKEAKKLTGIDDQPLLLQSSVMNNIKQEEEYLEPTELGELFDISAKEMNLILERLSLQYKKGDHWYLTNLGKKYAIKHAWVRGTKSGYNYKWQVKEISKLIDAYKDDELLLE